MKNVEVAAPTGRLKLPAVPAGPPGVADGPPGAPAATPGTSTRALSAAPKSIRWSALLGACPFETAVTTTCKRPGTGWAPFMTWVTCIVGVGRGTQLGGGPSSLVMVPF